MEARSFETAQAAREAASAWLDGQADGMSLSALLESDAARFAFADHAAVSDALRSSRPKRSDAAFLGDLHSRIQRESIAIENIATNVQNTPTYSQFDVKMGEKTGSEHTHAAPARQAAANDSRWRLVAGFAGFAAVASVAFGGWQAQRAASTDAQLAALQASNAGVVTAAARPKATAEQIVLVNGEPHVMVRDPRLAELVAQHRQLGGGMHHTQAGFFRASTIEPGLR